MTRFVGEAINTRVRQRTTYTHKELRKNMQKFLETGVHPDLEKAKHEHKLSMTSLPPLPLKETGRPYVFLEFSIGTKIAGRVVVELFEDLMVLPASHFRNRCHPKASDTLLGCTIHKILPNFAVYGGHSKGQQRALQVTHNEKLRHVEAGAWSVSHDGTEFACSLTRAIALDSTHQVIGRVHTGMEVINTIAELQTFSDDSPVDAVVISKCGVTNYKGDYCELEGGALHASVAPKFSDQLETAREAVRDALATGLQDKRKAGQSATASSKRPRRGMLDMGLADSSSVDDEDDDDNNDSDDDAGHDVGTSSKAADEAESCDAKEDATPSGTQQACSSAQAHQTGSTVQAPQSVNGQHDKGSDSNVEVEAHGSSPAKPQCNVASDKTDAAAV